MELTLAITPQYAPTLTKLRDEGKLNFFEEQGACGIQGLFLNNSKPPFNDIKLRKAANLALDRTALLKIMYPLGTGRAMLLYFPEPMDYSIPASQIWDVAPGWGTGAKKAQEIEEAKKLVVDAGYPKGLEIPQMTKGASTTTGGGATHEPIQQMLGVVGIKTTLDVVTNLVVWEQRMVAGDYFMISYTLCVPTKDPDYVIGSYFVTGGARNWMQYSNKEVNRLFPLMSGELDFAKRKQLYLQIQDIIAVQDAAYPTLPQSTGWFWWWPNLRGFIPSTDQPTGVTSTSFYRADTLWLSE